MKNRLIWLLLAVIAFDFGITLLGQPASYWQDPQTANEGTPAFKWFMVHGIVCYAAFILAYLAAAGRELSRNNSVNHRWTHINTDNSDFKNAPTYH